MFVDLTGDKYDRKDPNAYDPDHFYTLETGREQVQVRVSEGVKRSISRLVEDPRFIHYQTSADFLRDAIVHRVHYWLEQVKDPRVRLELEKILEGEQTKAFWIQRGKAVAECTAVVERMISTMQAAIAKGQTLQPEEDRSIIAFLTEQAHLMDPDQFSTVYMLRLYFMTDPKVLLADDRINGDEEWIPDYLADWERREAFFKHHPTDEPITRDQVMHEGIDITLIQANTERDYEQRHLPEGWGSEFYRS